MTFVPVDNCTDDSSKLPTDTSTDQPTGDPAGQPDGTPVEEEPGPVDRRIMLIGADNRFCHVYGDLDELLEEPKYYDKLQGGLEFFDATGRRLAPVFTEDWHLQGFQPTVAPAEPEVLRQRMKEFVAYLAKRIQESPHVIGDHRVSAADAIARLPEIDHVEFGEAVGAMPRHERGNSGNLLHNAAHAVGIDH